MKKEFFCIINKPPFDCGALLLAALIPAFLSCSTTQTVPGSTLTDGLQADAPVYDIVNAPPEGRENVIKVKGAHTRWAVVMYSLEEYIGKEITIELSVDVKRTGAAGNLNWQVNNDGEWPSVTSLENAAAGVWHRMKGRLFVTPVNDKPYLYLTNWENNANNTVYYIDNFNVTIAEGNPHTPDLALTPLKTLYADDFPIGNIVDNKYSTGKHLDLLMHHYSAVSSAVTYPVLLAPSAKGGAYQWETADRIIDLVISNGIPVHGHVLVWHESSPAWITAGTKDEVTSNMKRHIAEALNHFKGRIGSWDVVNEGIRDNLSAGEISGDWKRCVRRSETWMQNPWYDKLGPDYIEIAFRAARSADPNVTLYYNDYGLDNQNKAEAVRKMISDINTRYRAEGNARNLIEGVGMQGHYSFKLNVDDVRKSLEKLTSLGVEIAISELDISVVGYDPGNGRDTVMSEHDANTQARLYAQLFKLYREYAAHITRVTMWGMDDGTSWLSAGNPCLFDWKLNAKKSFYAVSDPDAFLAQQGE